jgi:2-oxoisovalerate dehydrogenase E2 component (dihydrolipoyl transacylase)
VSSVTISMPKLGESVHEGVISRWLVKPGDAVTEFEPMVEVETDKVSTEVPSSVTGVVERLIAAEGETVGVGGPIALVALIENGDRPTPAPPPAAAAPRDVATAVAGPAEGRSPRHRVNGVGVRNSPAVRELARQHGLDLSQLAGTGLGGRVTRADVEKHLAVGVSPAPSAPVASVAITPDGDEAIPLTRVRRLIAENMTRSKQTIPHAWQTQEVDMSGVVANRSAHKAEFQLREGFSLTYLPYVIKAAASGLAQHREVNATFNETEIIVHRDVNIGVSIGLEDTLLVPVIRGADGLSVAGIARAVADLVERARNRKLGADDLRGATFTVNNSGTFGTLFSYSVINPGQAGILTMEAIVERPVAVKGMLAIKPLMYLCFSLDHRVLDGMQGARFLSSCRRWLEQVTPEMAIY